MKRMIYLAVVGSGLVIAACSSLALAQGKNARIEGEARRAMEEFYRVFNEADNEALQQYMNFPHVFLSRNGRVLISEERWTIDFDRMREREGWSSSTLDSVEAGLIMVDKVHFNIVFSRHRADGTVYRTVPGMWIVTKKDGRWGVQVRSY